MRQRIEAIAGGLAYLLRLPVRERSILVILLILVPVLVLIGLVMGLIWVMGLPVTLKAYLNDLRDVIYTLVQIVAALFLFMLMWGISGFYLGVPEPFSNFVDSMSDPEAILGERPGDVVLTWLTRLHFGRWRDAPVLKAVWAIVGLIPAVMLVTGVIMWWNRVLRKRANVIEPSEVSI